MFSDPFLLLEQAGLKPENFETHHGHDRKRGEDPMRFSPNLVLVLFVVAGCATPITRSSDFITVEELVAKEPKEIHGDEVHVVGWVCVDGYLLDLRVEDRCDDVAGIKLNVPGALQTSGMRSGRALITGVFVDSSEGEMLLNYKRNKYLGNFSIDITEIVLVPNN